MNARALPPLAHATTATLVVILGLQLASWCWHFAGPVLLTKLMPARGAAATPPDTKTVDLTIARKLFGGEPVAATPATSFSGELRLKGVFAVDGKSLSAAIINAGGRDLVVFLGQEIVGNIKLTNVRADYITVNRDGIDSRVELDRFRGEITNTVRSTPAASNSFRLSVNNFNTNSYSLSRQELSNVLQDPRQLEFLGRIGQAPNGGVRVEDAPPGTLAGKLGLKNGDIITVVNGQTINSAGDLARFYQQFGSISEIRVEVRRGGAPTMLTYTLQN